MTTNLEMITDLGNPMLWFALGLHQFGVLRIAGIDLE
jgi:hypothetical protein